LSAYRKKLIMPFMDEWVNQLFWGKPANIGEDRAITNLILRDGYDVVFQQPAIAYTEVPKSYKGLCKMLIRWARSNVRENIAMTEFTFKRFNLEDENLLGMQLNLIMQSVWMITPLLFLSTTFYCLFVDPWTFLYSVLTVIIIWSTFPAFVYAKRYDKNEALWSYVYGVFNFVALSWIGPYSVLTVYRSGWLTRQEPKGPATAPVGAALPAEPKKP
jgi:hyaluronan synthase